tara:strand:+ start:1165 stop:2259 length:1095 start_codon:yes stop_codon:yes gene_type:complete
MLELILIILELLRINSSNINLSLRNLILISFLLYSCSLFEPADNINPTCIINHPENLMQLSIRDTIKITSIDEYGISKVKCSVDDNITSYIIEDTEKPYHLPFSFLENHNDTLTISCQSFDNNNNKSKSYSISVRINNDINPFNGYHDGDELFKNEIIELNQIMNNFLDENISWNYIDNLNRITKLKYRNINIDTIPVSIENLSHLSQLEFINNNLSNLPNSIKNLMNLEIIRFQNNNLYEIPDYISTLKNLEIIDFSDNYINVIPDVFTDLGCEDCRLKILKLQNNQLKFIDVTAFNFLEILWLANNKLENINITCQSNVWLQEYNQLSPVLTLSQNNLCEEGSINSDDDCVDNWEIGVQNCN